MEKNDLENKIHKNWHRLIGLAFTIIGLVIIIFVIIQVKSCHKTKDKIEIYNKLDDSTSVLTSDNINTFLSIKSKDSLILKLQSEVKDYKKKLGKDGSVTDFSTDTKISKTTKTVVTNNNPVIVSDTCKKDSICNPIYSTSYSDKWITYNLQAKKDSTKLDLKTTDIYSVILGQERPKWYKKKVDFVDVISDSPYSKVKSVKSYKVTDNRKPIRFSLGIQLGYGITVQGFSITPSPYIGVGGQFNIFNFK